MLDIQKLLKQFGAFIYTGDRLGDLEIMSAEVDELFKMKLIDNEQFQSAKLILLKEIRQFKERNKIK